MWKVDRLIPDWTAFLSRFRRTKSGRRLRTARRPLAVWVAPVAGPFLLREPFESANQGVAVYSSVGGSQCIFGPHMLFLQPFAFARLYRVFDGNCRAWHFAHSGNLSRSVAPPNFAHRISYFACSA